MSNSDNFFESSTYKDGVFKGLLPEYYPKKYQNYIKEEVVLLQQKVKGAKRILEAGVGIGRLIPKLAPLVDELVGIDDAQFMLNKSKAVAAAFLNVQIVEAKIEHLHKRYPAHYFDHSLCVWNTFGNIDNQVIVLQELAAVTAGSIFITVFHKNTLHDRLELYEAIDVQIERIDKENETFYLHGYVSRTFNAQDIADLAQQAGLKVVETQILGEVILWAELRAHP